MSCICYICASQESSPLHSSFVHSAFTQVSCTGNLYIHDYFISCEQSYLGFRLNRFLSIHALDSVLVFPTWTIEDCLFIEIYQNTTLIGLGKIFLAQCSFDGMQNITKIEWFTELTPQVSVNMTYQPISVSAPNCVAVYRETLGNEESEKLHIRVKCENNEIVHKIKDFSLAFKEEIWQQVVVVENKFDVELVLECEEKKNSLILPKPKSVPIYSAIPTPGADEKLLALYIVPFFSYFLKESSNSLFLQVQKVANVWIESLAEGTVFNVALKSSMCSEGVNNEVSVPIQEFGECFEYQFISYTPEDKIVIKCLEDGKLSGVGILKLKELAGLSPDTPLQTSAQIGYNSCQFWITCRPRARDENAVKLEGNQDVLNLTNKKLTFKDPIFLDVLELLEYKINKLKKKNSLETTQINKVNSKNEWLKKKISELERAPNLTDYKANLTKKTGSKTETIKKEAYEGICGCGRPNPKFKGYCEECVKNIKATYERVYNWFSPIEKKHSELENKFISINGRKILLELKIKRLEEKISRQVEVGEDDEIETAMELSANLKKIEEEIKNLQYDSESTANLYIKQQVQLEKEIEKNSSEKEKFGKDVEQLKVGIVKNEEIVEVAKERVAFKQYFNDKYS